jgi:hypothetical protein
MFLYDKFKANPLYHGKFPSTSKFLALFRSIIKVAITQNFQRIMFLLLNFKNPFSKPFIFYKLNKNPKRGMSRP